MCYLKNVYLVTADSTCLQSCQFTLLYSIFITEIEVTEEVVERVRGRDGRRLYADVA